ncbi:MAG: LPS export ABC transporter periplasmic protein LptC [Desulfobacterales bacterium]|jgi:LPS export ABC transporter protein LptC
MLPSKRLLKTMLVIGIALILALLVMVFIKYREISQNPAMLADAIPEGVDISIGEIQHTAVKDGRKQWSLKAASAQYSKKTEEAVFEDVQVTFFMDDGREVMVQGRQGRLNTETNNIEIAGEVIARDADYQLAAETIHYNHADRRINIPTAVKITSQAFELQANEMTVDLASETALFQGEVKGVISGDNRTLF